MRAHGTYNYTSPNVYLDRFNTYRKVDSESYVAFASRLKGLLNYYLESRHVDDFDGLFELLICDRIKSSLSEACLRHVLSVENATERGWLDVDALPDCDVYVGGKVRVAKIMMS